MKYAIPDSPNSIDLTCSPENHLLQVGQKWIVSVSLKTRNLQKIVKKFVLKFC